MGEQRSEVEHLLHLFASVTDERAAATLRELFEDQVPVTAIFARLDQQDAMLREHGQKLDEHSRILNEHGQKLDEHTRILDEHTRILNEHGQKFDEHTHLLEQSRAAVIELVHEVELLRREIHAQREQDRAEREAQRQQDRAELQAQREEDRTERNTQRQQDRAELKAQREESRAEFRILRQEGRAELHEALADNIRAQWRMAMGSAVLLSIMLTGLVVTLAELL